MAMFVTFYSFKGGVGRTLALANVATQLARDAFEQCRVLVWDFDLAAPGLQQVFKHRGRRRYGFVDFVDHYLSKAKIDNISDYICETDVSGVDLLPAGYMNRQYAAKLDKIHWREIYDEALGFDFIEAVKKQISEITPQYDYVLIDSLTGYSDVGGICVNQIPELAVLLFRLNQQNLTGISKVYQGIRSANTRKPRPVMVVPVISPAWPFASPEAHGWTAKVEELFSGEEVLSISFEGSLTFGEKIVSRDRSEYKNLRIIADYERLTEQIRSLNSEDLTTIYKNVRKLRDENQYRAALDACIKLVKQRPDRERYWRQLTSTVFLAPRLLRTKLADAANKIIDEQVRSLNPLSLIARAELTDGLRENWQSAYADLSRAIELAPTVEDSYFSRGNKCIEHRMLEQAIQDFSQVIALQKAKHNPSWLMPAHVQRGYAYLRLGKTEKALLDFSAAVDLDPTDVNVLVYRANALLLTHRYEQARVDIEKALELSPSSYEPQIFRAHLQAIAGQKDAAKQQLQKIETAGIAHLGAAADLAEVYLVVSPSETLRVLNEYLRTAGTFQVIFVALRAFAAELLNDHALFEQSIQEVKGREEELKDSTWFFIHLREFLHWAPAQHLITDEQRMRLSEVLDYIENPGKDAATKMENQVR
jgi:MinD-like ATPase involved in chromosome partitioning or flagellar assembly/tetratricopeptide (TPR) repeat protein